jgi:hypothetical protein
MPPMPKDRNQRERKEARDKFHGAMTRTVNSPRFKNALEAFEEDPEAAKGDPKGFLHQHGVDLPAEATVEVIEREGSYCWCVRICILWWCWDVCVCIS